MDQDIYSDKPQKHRTEPYTFDQVRLGMLELRRTLSLRELSRMTDGKVSYGTIKRVLEGHEPKDPEIRRALGLNVSKEVEVCPSCQVVHKTGCPRTRHLGGKDLFSRPKWLLLWMLENREEMEGNNDGIYNIRTTNNHHNKQGKNVFKPNGPITSDEDLQEQE